MHETRSTNPLNLINVECSVTKVVRGRRQRRQPINPPHLVRGSRACWIYAEGQHLQSSEAKPPPPPLTPASAANLVHCVPFFHSFFACFSILYVFTYLSQNTSQKGVRKRQQSQKSIKNHSLNLAWKSCLQNGSPKCENHTLFNV